MVMARAIERRVWLLDRTGQVEAGLSASGSEAVQVAAAATLRPGIDWVLPKWGDLALCLAMGVTAVDVLLGVFGRARDPLSHGRLEPGALSSKAARIVTTSSSPGARALHAAGIAYASRFRSLDEITMVSIDARGALSGDWHEGVNFAAVHRLPLVCLLTSRVPGTAEPPAQPETDPIARQAVGYGVAAATADGGDFRDSLTAITQAVQRARSGGGPTLVHAFVREGGAMAHGAVLRTPEELEAQASLDPIELMR
ncbi:MAG TPA: thiamine pyrophosphate-dependent enzyme, partial [Patescibacteria group bacterium]|nr:thiamine pyrophosphate-dependent enzyme [Patescibacteria group bacterium]